MKKGILIGILAALIVAVAGYLLFSNMFEPIETDPSLSEVSLAVSSEEASLESSPPESSLPDQPESDPFVGAPIPQNADAKEMSWLDDAVFIGDSLTYGLSAYEILPQEQVLAHTGINPQTILTSACIETSAGEKTVLDALKALSPGKIYIMLGANGVGFLSSDTIVDCYGQLIDGILADHPGVPIYLQSILPVTAEKSSDEKYANSKIDQYNQAIEALAAEKGVYYLNVAEALKDENGNLPSGLSSDGMHFGPSTYQIWLEYLLDHRAE